MYSVLWIFAPSFWWKPEIMRMVNLNQFVFLTPCIQWTNVTLIIALRWSRCTIYSRSARHKCVQNKPFNTSLIICFSVCKSNIFSSITDVCRLLFYEKPRHIFNIKVQWKKKFQSVLCLNHVRYFVAKCVESRWIRNDLWKICNQISFPTTLTNLFNSEQREYIPRSLEVFKLPIHTNTWDCHLHNSTGKRHSLDNFISGIQAEWTCRKSIHTKKKNPTTSMHATSFINQFSFIKDWSLLFILAVISHKWRMMKCQSSEIILRRFLYVGMLTITICVFVCTVYREC